MEAIKISDYTNHTIPENDVIKRILSGEKELYEILLRRNNQKLYRIIRSYINDQNEIEDLMQNTYLKAYEKLFQFKFKSSFSTWLIRIAINESLARIKEKGRIRAINLQTGDEYQVFEIPDTEQLNPENKIIMNEEKQLLENAIDSLDSKYKSVYVLSEIEEMTMKEISQCTGLSVSNVKVRLFRAKTMLKEKLYELANNKGVFEFGFSRCDRITKVVMSKI